MEAYQQIHAPEEIEEGVKGERNSMRKLAAQERAAERKEKGGAAAKMPGREGPSVGRNYADYQEVSMKAYDKLTKKTKPSVVGMTHEEVENVDEATAMAKRGYDETKLRSRAGGGEAADRASALEKQSTYGDANKAKQRQNYARAQRGDFRKTASSNPGLHVGQHKSDDPAVKAKQAARGAQRGALTPNERKQLNMGDETFDIFDIVLEYLQEKGYVETLEEAKWMMTDVLDEEIIGLIADLDEATDTWNPETDDPISKKIQARLKTIKAPEKKKENRYLPPLSMVKSMKKKELETEGYQRNPEKGEKEDRKYEPVRGEKTPMPPRGNKKREDFEKWYAANVR